NGVVLSSYVIQHHIGSSDWRENTAHSLRWARSTRRSRPLGYLGQLFTLLVRGLAAYVVSGRVLKAKPNWWLLPIEDLMAFSFWIAGFFGNTITWRGRRYRLQRDGRFELISGSNP